jgi:hypothetical protein
MQLVIEPENFDALVNQAANHPGDRFIACLSGGN